MDKKKVTHIQEKRFAKLQIEIIPRELFQIVGLLLKDLSCFSRDRLKN